MPQFNMTNYMEGLLANHLFRGTTWSKPTTLYVALCTGVIPENVTGATLPECANAGAYARVALAPSDTNWGAGSAGALSQDLGSSGMVGNNSQITFPTATAAWAGVVGYVALCQSGEYGAGEVYMYGQLSNTKSVGINDTFSFGVSGILAKFD